VVGGSPNPAYSRAVVVDRLVFVAGVVGARPGGGGVPPEFEAQCRQALDNLKASVEAAGSRLAWVLKCTCFLTNAADFAVFNKMFAEYFPSDPPARSTVVVKELVVPGGTIEIDCVACLE
jgi:2-iminobutanoate/2-iminopropanoate deaminase